MIILFEKIFRSIQSLFEHEKKEIPLEDYIKMRVKNGEDPKEIKKELLSDLEEGGPIFKDFIEAFKPTYEGSVSRFDDSEITPEEMFADRYIWNSVLLRNTCDDCRSRHGKIMSWKEWEREGLPREAKTKCGKQCKCVLMPAYNQKLKINK